MNVLDRRSSGAMVVCALKMVRVHPPDLSDRNPGGHVHSAALPRARFFREECRAVFILLTRVKVLIAIFLKMLGQAWKLYTLMPL